MLPTRLNLAGMGYASSLLSSHTVGGFIHILLVLAIIVILIRVIRGE